jgi:hypothetical protein
VKDFGLEFKVEQMLNLILMASVDEKYSPINIDAIITNKNITDKLTIKALRGITFMKNREMQSNKQAERST